MVPRHPQAPHRDNFWVNFGIIFEALLFTEKFQSHYSFIKFADGLAKQMSRQLRTLSHPDRGAQGALDMQLARQIDKKADLVWGYGW